MTANESERDNQGRFAEQTSDDDILRVIRESEFPAVTARELDDLDSEETTLFPYGVWVRCVGFSCLRQTVRKITVKQVLGRMESQQKYSSYGR